MKIKLTLLFLSTVTLWNIQAQHEYSYPSCDEDVHGHIDAHMDCPTDILITSLASDGIEGTVVYGLVTSDDYVLITSGHSFVKIIPDADLDGRAHKTKVGVPPPPPPPPPNGGRYAPESKSLTLTLDKGSKKLQIYSKNNDIVSYTIFDSFGNLVTSKKVNEINDLVLTQTLNKDKFYIIKIYTSTNDVIVKKIITQ